MRCKLCKLPIPSPVISDGDDIFCCLGCKSVYQVFAANPLLPTSSSKVANVSSKTTLNEPKTLPEGAKETFLRIEGMHCSSCEILLEQLIIKAAGIHSISTSYATSTAKVVYFPDKIQESELPSLINKIGYKAYFSYEKQQHSEDDRSLLWMVCAVGLAGMVMMLNLAFFYPIDFGLVEPDELKPVAWLAFDLVPKIMLLLTSILIFFIGLPILKGAWIGIRTGIPNMDNLLTIAILAAYGYSIGQLYLGELTFYFDVAAVIVGVVTVGRYLERSARQTATRELAEIINHWSPIARVKRNGQIFNCHISKLLAHDILHIQEGEAIPVDGSIIDGKCAIDEALISGESCPVSKQTGDQVLGGSVLIEGNISIQIGSQLESRIDTLAKLLWNVQSSAKGASSIGHKIAQIFVPGVLILSFAITAWLIFNGTPYGQALMAGLTTLIVSCPCTFGLAVPLTTATAISSALQKGIIFSSTDIFEKQNDFKNIAIDKTGTLSNGLMEVSKIYASTQAIQYAAAIERLAKHPIAAAIASLNDEKQATDLIVHPGKGAQAMVDQHQVTVGSRALMQLLGWKLPAHFQAVPQLSADEVISYIAWENKVQGAIVTRDQKRPAWRNVIKQLKQNHRVILITGSQHSMDYNELVDEAYTEVPPEAKAALIHHLQTQGKVAMIGDGSNDAPALAAADLGIAFGAPTALAAEAADIVIPGDHLEKIFIAFKLIKTTRLRVRQNIGWALVYNAIAIPLAIAGFLNPLLAAIAMASSSLLVVWNSSRHLRFATP